MNFHASCSVCGHIHARRGEDGMVNLKTRTCRDCGVCERIQEWKREDAIYDLEEQRIRDYDDGFIHDDDH